MHLFLAGLEDYLPLLLFIAIWWISSKKKKAGQRRTEEASPARASHNKDEGVRLREILERILSGEMEMPQRRQTAAGAARPAPPPSAGPPARSRPDIEEGSSPLKTGEAPPIPAPPRGGTASAAGPGMAGGPGPVRREECAASNAGRINRRALRRAVVWSEILAPPVSLRK